MATKRSPALRLAQPFRLFVQRFAFLSLVIASFGLMVFGKADPKSIASLRTSISDAVAPILDVMSRPTSAVSNTVSRLEELRDIRAHNESLIEENRRLLEWRQAALELQAQNQSLRELLNFDPPPPPEFVTARVIGDPGGPFAQSVLLNVGARDGITKGQAVITGEEPRGTGWQPVGAGSAADRYQQPNSGGHRIQPGTGYSDRRQRRPGAAAVPAGKHNCRPR